MTTKKSETTLTPVKEPKVKTQVLKSVDIRLTFEGGSTTMLPMVANETKNYVKFTAPANTSGIAEFSSVFIAKPKGSNKPAKPAPKVKGK